MGETKNLQLAILGIVIGVIGVIGTFYQILAERILWIVLIISGFILTVLFLRKSVSEWRIVVRTFGARWSLENGRLVIGNTVNVALRAKTVQHLLDGFQKPLGDRYSLVLKDLGSTWGKSFADDLKKELTVRGITRIIKSGRNSGVLEDKLSLWAEYDSSTGMGIFSIDHIEVTTSGLQGYVLLRNSFLSYDRQSECPVCTLIEGYLEGIIDNLLGIRAVVKEIDCGAVTGSEYCRFQISQPPNK